MNPYYTFVQNSFPGRIARASEVNTQFALIEAGFTALGTIPAGVDTQVQFNDGGILGGDPEFTWNKTTNTLTLGGPLSVAGAVTGASFSGGAATFSGQMQAASALVTGTSNLQGNVTAGGTLSVTGKVTSAATVGGDSSTTNVTKGYAEATFAPVSHNHAASQITSGTFADARISQTSITQHQAAIDHNQLTNYSAAQHRIINDAGTSLTELWSSSKINTEMQNIIAGANPPAGPDGAAQFNDGGIAGGQAEFSWNDATHTLTVGTVTNAGSINVVGGGLTAVGGTFSGKVTSAATAGGDPAGTVVTKGYAEATFAPTSHSHAAGDVTSGVFADARIPALNASKITAGTFPVGRGGTGLSSFSGGGLFLRTETTSTMATRTAAQVLTDIGAAPLSHNHSAANITSGTLVASRGGTGIGTYTVGNYVNAASASALQQRTPAQVLSDIGAAASSHTHSGADITSGTISADRLPVVTAAKGGTGLSSYTAGNYVNALNATTLQQRTPSQVLSDIGAASASHNHSAANITSGTLSTARLPTIPVTKGGTGLTSLTSGSYLRGAGTSNVALVTPADVRTDIGAAASSHSHTYSDLTLIGAQTILGNSASSGFGSASPLTASTVRGIVNVLQPHVASSGSTKVTVSTSAPSGGVNGDIWLRV